MFSRKQSKLITTLLTLVIAILYSYHKGDLALLDPLHLSSVTAADATSSYPVVHVVDGDTLDIEKGGTKVRLRLIGINSPESVDPRRPVECFGKEASRYASNILEGQHVTIEFDPSQGRVDKYGRTLAYVFLPNGQNFNELMVRDGYAYEYTYNTPYKYQKEFKAAEQEARQSERGLWASTTCSGVK